MKPLLRAAGAPPTVPAKITAPLALLSVPATDTCRPACQRNNARQRNVSFAFPPRGIQHQRRLPRRMRRPSPDSENDRSRNNSNLDDSNNEAEFIDDNVPMSLAALSKLQASRQQQHQQHRTAVASAKTTSPVPSSHRAAPAAPSTYSPGSATFSSVATLPAPTAPAPAPLQQDLQDPASRCQILDPVLDPDSRNPAPPEPRHPPVAFRNVAELQRMLQDRQVAAGGKTAAAAPPPRATRPAAAPPAAATDTGPGGGGGGEAAGISSPPRPPLPPPRRFFGATPPPHAPVTDLGPVPPPDHESALPAVADGLGSETGNVVDSDLEEDQAYQKAKRYALSLLQRSPLSAATLTRRLLARGLPGHLLPPLVAWLGAAGALNDRLYARMYAASKWNANRTAPAKIKQELTALGVGDADVAAALVHVFGPTRRIRLSGPTTSPEELEVREALLEAARRHVGLQHKPQTSHRNHHHDDEELPPPQQHQHQYQYQYQYQGTAAMEESFYGDRSYATAATAAASASSSSTTIETVAAAFGTSSSRTTSSSASASAADDVGSNVDFVSQNHHFSNDNDADFSVTSRGTRNDGSNASNNSSRSGSSSGADSSSSRSSGAKWLAPSGRAGGRQADRSADEWKARVKEQNMQRRRLSSWLQYRGHDMGVVLKVFELLGI